MNQLKGLASSLGIDLDNMNMTNAASHTPPPAPPEPTQSNDNMDFMAMLGGLLGGNQPPPPPPKPAFDPQILFKLQSALSLLREEDNNTALLRALRPLLSEERQKKVDDAIKIMQLIRLLPLVKELGLFSSS